MAVTKPLGYEKPAIQKLLGRPRDIQSLSCWSRCRSFDHQAESLAPAMTHSPGHASHSRGIRASTSASMQSRISSRHEISPLMARRTSESEVLMLLSKETRDRSSWYRNAVRGALRPP
eukprot:scaffold614_cov255-Pinguiococcus_pyrenoidosus.AAC.8